MARRRSKKSRLLEQVQETLVIFVVGVVVIMVVGERVFVEGVEVPLEKILSFSLQGATVLAVLYLAYSMRTLPNLIKQARKAFSKKVTNSGNRAKQQALVRKRGPLFRGSQQSQYKKFWKE